MVLGGGLYSVAAAVGPVVARRQRCSRDVAGPAAAAAAAAATAAAVLSAYLVRVRARVRVRVRIRAGVRARARARLRIRVRVSERVPPTPPLRHAGCVLSRLLELVVALLSRWE